MTVAASNFTAESDPSFTAYDAIGQHDTTETPLQEAMIAATVANGGVLMKPYLVQQVTASDLSVVEQTQPQELSQPISSTVAGYEKQMMIAVVQQPEGTGYAFNQNNEERPGNRRQDRHRPERRERSTLMLFSPLSPRLTTQR